MKTNLRIDVTVEKICEGFVYNELEGKGLFGLAGKLVIQPEYQRNYLYKEQKREQAVIESVRKGYPLGLLYFNKVGEDKYEVLDGQQRITSLGRFLTAKFALEGENGARHYFSSLPKDEREKILKTPLTIYICEGEEKEIKEWFQTINIAGIPLNGQETANAIYSGPFVTLAKQEFSNTQNANIQKWSAYIKGAVNRQNYLYEALRWVSKTPNARDYGKIDPRVGEYMSAHRYEKNIDEVKTYFGAVIDWISGTFTDVKSEMCGLDWGRLYEEYHNTPYNPKLVNEKVQTLYADEAVKNKKGVFEYILGGCKDARLLEIRFFEESTKKSVYTKQTEAAVKKKVSNCPLCAVGEDNNKGKIWKYTEMDADHVTAWSKGGKTDAKNCQMLCKTHNRSKGNK